MVACRAEPPRSTEKTDPDGDVPNGVVCFGSSLKTLLPLSTDKLLALFHRYK